MRFCFALDFFTDGFRPWNTIHHIWTFDLIFEPDLKQSDVDDCVVEGCKGGDGCILTEE